MFVFVDENGRIEPLRGSCCRKSGPTEGGAPAVEPEEAKGAARSA